MADSGQVEVFVQIGGEDVAAGDLWMRRAGRSQSANFAYRPSYIGRNGAYQLEPDPPLQTGQFQTPVDRSLFGAFSDTAPDRRGRKLIERTEAASAREERRTARSFSEADYLLGVRDDLRQGALRYRRPDGDAFLATEDTGVPALLQLGTLLNAAEALERDDPTSQQLRLLLEAARRSAALAPKRMSSAPTAVQPSRSSPAPRTTTGTSSAGSTSRWSSLARPASPPPIISSSGSTAAGHHPAAL